METLRHLFVRDISNLPNEYMIRLQEEINMLEKMDYIWFLCRFVEIFNNHIKNNLYLLRGSAGSSLLLYYLGINEIDPILYQIPLARFMNSLRITKPDIDIDLPQNLRDQIMNIIVEQNKDTIRMSCNLKNEDNEYFDSLIREHPQINSIHNSGIIIFNKEQEDTIKKHLITETQISLTKDEINNFNLKKVDLLSNTALEQLNKIKTHIEINYNFEDEHVFNFIKNDDGCGITYAETPLIQYVIHTLKPSSINELSICLAIVRPFACKNIHKYMTYENLKNKIIYDDDFILKLINCVGLSEGEADQIRRMCKKGTDLNEIEQFKRYIDSKEITIGNKIIIKKAMSKLRSYGFCKSHSLSYSRLIYMLYYCKCYYPKIFWKSTMETIKGYYNDWVYIRKGLSAGLKFKGIKKCDAFTHFIHTGYWLNNEFMSKCYLKIFDSKFPTLKITINDAENETDIGTQLKTDFNEDEIESNFEITNEKNNINNIDIDNYYTTTEKKYNNKNITCENTLNTSNSESISLNKECEFRGIIAGASSSFTKYKKYQTIITIGYDNNKFIDLYLNKKRDFKKFKQVIGKGYYIKDNVDHIIITHMKIF